MDQNLLSMPFLRLLTPYVAGICFYYNYEHPVFYLVFLGIGICGFMLYIFYGKKYDSRYMFGFSIFCLLLYAGAILTFCSLQRTSLYIPSCQLDYLVKVTGEPVEKPASYRFTVQSSGFYSGTDFQRANYYGILYIAKDSLSACIRPGQLLKVKSKLNSTCKTSSSIQDPYLIYLRDKGFSFQGYVFKGNWQPVDTVTSSPDFRLRALQCRRVLLEKLKALVKKEDAYGVAAALLFGYKEELPEDTKAAFSITGTGHVLVVSGLHTAILYGTLLFPFALFGNSRKMRILRQVIVIPCMWIFAFITGLAPSVVRATIMLSLYALGDITGRRSVTINIVCATAFCMLVYEPLYLYDVGFQLSFAAVAAIVTINPLLSHYLSPAGRILKYPVGLLTVSTSAQLGTFPLTLYYFHHFPVFFLLSNLFVIPLVTLLLILILFYFILSWLVSIPEFFLYPLNFFLDFFIRGVQLLSDIPGFSIDGIQISKGIACFLYLFIFLWMLFLKHQRLIYIGLCGLLFILQLIYYL